MRVYASISKSALRHNISRVRDFSPNSKIMAVIKANGYGHGLVRVASVLQSYANAFAVATVDEAIELRDSGIQIPICVLSGFYSSEHVDVVQAKKIDCVIHCDEQIEILQKSQSNTAISVWIKVDTGMHRLGFPPDRLPVALHSVNSIENLELKGIMSHFACADELNSDYTLIQIDRFAKCTDNFKIELSIANSAGLMYWPSSHYNWVRPGIMLYGISPVAGVSAQSLDLHPAMEMYSTILSVNNIERGESIGYGQTWQCPERTRVGIVGCGYGDGYFRSASSKSQVLIGGKRVDVIGRVSMDSLAVNLNQHPGVEVGSRVKLFGDGLPVEELALAADTIPYEVVTSVNSRSIDALEVD